MRNFLVAGGLALLLSAGTASAQPRATGTDPMLELANLRQDVDLLRQRMGELSLNLEQMQRDNAALQARANESHVTLEQLNRAVADLNRTIQTALAEQKRDVLVQVGSQIEKLAKQTQAAIDAVARNEAARPAIQTSFSENYPKEGISYTVQPGESLAVIAKKTNSRVQDIINANKISDPSRIRAGQTLFIPQGK
ncbi:MAG TPA: LysM peptidoglycan-binding domain-containing protein [Candidatus Didemnitutus sp.]|jgi:LysM repeat protein